MVKHWRAGFILFASAVACAAPGGGSADTANAALDQAAVDAGHQRFLSAMRANSIDSLRPVIAENAVFTPPNVTIGPGREAFLAWYQQLLTQVRTTAVTVSDRDVIVAGDWAIEPGKFDWTVTPVAGGSAMRDSGHFLAIWHREPDGAWKVTRNVWNSMQPLPGSVPVR